MDMWTVLLTILFGGMCIYLYVTRNNNYFKNLGIPHIKPIPIFGNAAKLIFKVKTLPDNIQDSYNSDSTAKYVGYYSFSIPVIVLKDPELIKSIAIKNFDSFPNHRSLSTSATEPLLQKNLFSLKDEAWRDMRALLSPAFTSSKMKIIFKILADCAVNFADSLSKVNSTSKLVDIKDAFGRYTLDVIASSAFGLSLNSMEDRNNEFYRLGRDVSNFSGWKMIKFLIMQSCPWVMKILKLSILDPGTSKFFTNVIESTIRTRDEQGIVRPDMIHLLMQARDRKEKSDLSIEDITAQAFIFFLGGFESPAVTMSFAALCLALNPDVQRKLQTEIDEVLEEGSGQVCYDQLQAMKYLDAVVSETLRMYPPAPVMDRVASKKFTLPPALPGLEPLQIEPGQDICIPCHSFHYDPKYFPNPEVFDPERFNESNKSTINPLTYFPFGIGPRICIANRFALMEVKLGLFHLLAKCNLSPSPESQAPIKLKSGSFTVEPEGGFLLRLQTRT